MQKRPGQDVPDKLLFTPGPLTTSATVKQAMLHDVGSRDSAFIEVVRQIRSSLLKLGGVAGPDYEGPAYTAIPMQGSGTFGIEAVISSVTPPEGRWLMVTNGAYGRRMVQIASLLGIETTVLECAEDRTPDPQAVDAALAADAGLSHVAVVHCETTTGILNPVQEIGSVVRRHRRCFFVDAMSSFGAIPLQLDACGIDYLVSSANKCIEGVPGFSFVLARTEALLQTAGYARSLSLDLLAQWRGLETNGQFRFTPPTHALLAFHQALSELGEQGGVPGRAAHYQRNHQVLVKGMRQIGFREYLRPQDQSYIITSFRYPEHPNFDFGRFYQRLSDRGLVIYPGKVSDANCFRIGTIGRLQAHDLRHLLAAIEETLREMQVEL
jgi:2-aminoethylphosphonate-pyruvate transaminase